MQALLHAPDVILVAKSVHVDCFQAFLSLFCSPNLYSYLTQLVEFENGPGILARNLALCHGDQRRQERTELCQAILHACSDCEVSRQFAGAG